MKKIILSAFLIIGLVFTASSVFAYSYSGLGIQPPPEIDPLNEFKNDQATNLFLMPEKNTSGFTITQQDTDGIPFYLAIILNLVPSFGLGSFLQGNPDGGWLQFWLEGIPFGAGVFLFISGFVNDEIGQAAGVVLGFYLMGIGWIIGAVIGIITPLIYEASTRIQNNSTGLVFTGKGLGLRFYF